MPRSLSVPKSKLLSKSRSKSLNIQRLREDKKKKNASNKIKKFIKRVNDRYKGKMAVSRRNFYKAYQEQEQLQRNLYNRVHHTAKEVRANSRPMRNENYNLYLNLNEENAKLVDPEVYGVQLAVPENKHKTSKHYRSFAMVGQQNEGLLQMKIEQQIKLRFRYMMELTNLEHKLETTNPENEEEIEDLKLEIEVKQIDIEYVNEQLEKLYNPEPRHITTQKPVYIPEAQPLGRGISTYQEPFTSRLIINRMVGVNNNTINRIDKSGALVRPLNVRARHIGANREDIRREIHTFLRGRPLEDLTEEERAHIYYLRQLLLES